MYVYVIHIPSIHKGNIMTRNQKIRTLVRERVFLYRHPIIQYIIRCTTVE